PGSNLCDHGLMVQEQYTNVTPLPDTWNLLHGDLMGQPMLVRLNTAAERLAGQGSHDIRVGVAVPFNAPRPDGMPELFEDDMLADFEDQLAALANPVAALVAVITTGGRREFVLYTGSEWWIDAFRRELASAIPDHRVQVSARPDPEWYVYYSFRG